MLITFISKVSFAQLKPLFLASLEHCDLDILFCFISAVHRFPTQQITYFPWICVDCTCILPVSWEVIQLGDEKGVQCCKEERLMWKRAYVHWEEKNLYTMTCYICIPCFAQTFSDCTQYTFWIFWVVLYQLSAGVWKDFDSWTKESLLSYYHTYFRCSHFCGLFIIFCNRMINQCWSV